MQEEPQKKKSKLVESYLASLAPIEDALHLALLEADEAVKSKQHYLGTIWRLIGVNQEKKATFCDVNFEANSEVILEPVPNGLLKLRSLLKKDDLTIKSLQTTAGITLFGLSGLLRLIDVHRLKHIFQLCRHLLTSSNKFPLHQGSGKKAAGVINVVTSIFGDAALHREINPHPSSIHIYRAFIASSTKSSLSSDYKVNGSMLEAVLTAICEEIYCLKTAGSSFANNDSLFGISLTSQMALAFDSSVPFLYLDRFLSFEKLKDFVRKVLFSFHSRGSDDVELVLNAYVINDFENKEKDISNLPYIFPAHIHYSWALVKPSSSNEVLSTVLHGGQPPFALLFGSVFDDLSALQSYLRLFDSPQSINALSEPNDVFSLRQFYQNRLSYFAANRSFDNLFELSLTILTYGSTIGPPIFGHEIDTDAQKQLVESVSKFFFSNASALRSLVNYGMAIGICGSRFVGANENENSGNGRWYKMACENFADRINGFFGIDKIHYRTVPTPDSSPLTNILLTAAAAFLAESETGEMPICTTSLPNVIAGIALYSQVYWFSIATAATLSNCHFLVAALSSLRNNRPSDYSTDSPAHEITKPLQINGVVSKFMNYSLVQRVSVLGHKMSSTYLSDMMSRQFHREFAEMTHELLMTTLTSTPKPLGSSPDFRRQAPNESWLSVGARLAKFASVRGFASTSDGNNLLLPKKRHYTESNLGAHPAVQHHLSHCKGCSTFALRMLKIMQFIIPRSHCHHCFRPLLALSGSSILRCSYTDPDSALMMPPAYFTQLWLPSTPDAELVAAPMDSIAETVATHLSSLCVHGTPVQLLALRFVVLGSLTTFDEEDLSCYEIPPVDVALPVALRDIYGCAMELHRWWSVSPRHRVFLRGLININGPPECLFKPETPFQGSIDHNPCFVEVFVDIRPCFNSEIIRAFRPFDRLNHIFSTQEEYKHFEASFVKIASVNDTTVVGYGVNELDNAISMASFFNYPLVPFAQQQIDSDIHTRYAVAMASSNWFEAALLAHWHSILFPTVTVTNQCNCALMNAENVFRSSMTFAPLLRLPSWLKGLSSLAIYCRDSLIMALNFSSATYVDVGPDAFVGPFSSVRSRIIREQASLDDDLCQFERTLIGILAENVRLARDWASSKRTSEPDAIFSNEPTGYSAVAWAVAVDYAYHALDCVSPNETRWQSVVDKFSAAGHDLSKLAALALGYCDTISYYDMFAFSKKHLMVRSVSVCCFGDLSAKTLPTPARGIFRQDIVALTRTLVNE